MSLTMYAVRLIIYGIISIGIIICVSLFFPTFLKNFGGILGIILGAIDIIVSLVLCDIDEDIAEEKKWKKLCPQYGWGR